MPHPISIPRLGWSMEHGVFVGWLKSEGELVRPGEPLFTLEGEKAIQEIEAVDPGTLCIPPNAPQVGETVLVGAIIGYLLSPGETAPTEVPKPSRPASSQAAPAESRAAPAAKYESTLATDQPRTAPPASPAVRRLARELGVSLTDWTSPGRISETDVRRITEPTPATGHVPRRQRGLPVISPRAARIAAELSVDWTQLRGTGHGQRIREADVRRAAAQPRIAPRSQPAVAMPEQLPGQTVAAPTLRQTIAARLAHGWQQVVPVTLNTVADVSALLELRRRWKSEQRAVIPTVTDLIVMAVAATLAEHPLLKARWLGAAWSIPDATHIGIAVDTPDGLLVPVVRDVNTLSVTDLARQSRDLAERARARQLQSHELRDGVFTVTNLGTFGIDSFTPVLNFPESAILGVGAVRREPVVTPDDRIVPGDRISLSLTFDHRAIDGAPAARFLQTVCDKLQRTTFEHAD